MLHDVFICHASEDKETFVRPLAERLREHNVDVWYDEFSLTIGDGLREAIDRGLASSRFGVVVLSTAFFKKRWATRELNGLVAREIAEDRRIVLPIWHGITQTEILGYSPPLADVLATSSAFGMDRVVSDLLKRIQPEDSPLIVARDFLIEKGVPPPVITDEWWLDIVELKEGQFLWPDMNHDRRWIFPLPFQKRDHGRERGLNIAWTALQLDWINEAEERDLCQLTKPEVLHEFLRKWPGLLECARSNAAVLALYAPQLTIPGFDNGLEDVFDQLLDPARDDAYRAPGYGGGEPIGVDGNKPLCGELIAWRHPTLGNYDDADLAYDFVTADDLRYRRKLFSAFECLCWLLSDDSLWLPAKIRQSLVRGTRKRDSWLYDVLMGGTTFSAALPFRPRGRFKFTKAVRRSLVELIDTARTRLIISTPADVISERFIGGEFVEGAYEYREQIWAAQRSRT